MAKQVITNKAIKAIKEDEDLWRKVSDAMQIRSKALQSYLDRKSPSLNDINVVEAIMNHTGLTRDEILETPSIAGKDAILV